VEQFALGVIAALVLVGLVTLVVRFRRTPTIGQGEPSGQQAAPGPQPASAAPRETGAKHGIRVSRTVVTKRVVLSGQGSARAPAPGAQRFASIDDIPDPALRDQVRAAIADGGTTSETVVVDGKTYASLADIPDPAVRARLHSALESAVRTTQDPALDAELREELDELDGSTSGIPPEPPAA
jgi:hypothetical protein